MSDKNKAILTVGLSIVILAGIFLYQGISRHNALVQQAIDQEEKSFHARITALEKYSFGPYLSRIGNILQLNSQMVTAFANRNREILYSTTLPLYKALKKENRYFTVMHFHLPDSTTFLRMHNPDFFGDNLRNVRPIVDAVNKTRKPHSGFEIGRHGPFYRIAQPVFFEDNFVGVLEFGIKAHQLLEAAQIDLSDRTASYFLETEWRKVDQESQHFKMRQFGEFVLNTHNDPFYTSLPSKTDFNIHFNHLELDDKIYILHAQPVFKNYRQEVLGGITVLQDITNLVQQKSSFVIQMSTFVLLLTVLCLSILYISFNNLVSSLEKAQKKLKESVGSLTTEVKEREKAELALRKSQEEWERTFNAINDIVTLQDTSMKIVKVNKIGCDALGLPGENIIGKQCYELFHDSNEPCPECPLLETKKTFKPYTKEMTHEKLGKTFLVSAAPVLDDQGNLTHITHVAKDITEKKKIEERLFLNEKMATIAGLAAGVAHEINTPLSAILQSQQLIEMRLDPDKPRNLERAAECGVDLTKVATYFKNNELDVFMKGMRDSAITAGDIIKNLLEFSRPRKGEIRNANLSNLLDTTLQLARADYDLKKKYDIINVEITKEYDPDLTEVPCVAMEIEQVILNLIKNAVHAMADDNTKNPCITIRTVKTEKMACIEVEDNGPGIDEETQLHIFDPFFTTKEVGQGTGLGLSVSHALVVDKHRGNIWVESEPGKGAKFIIELPLSQKV
jgi:PAS domain S-box-containing protein